MKRYLLALLAAGSYPRYTLALLQALAFSFAGLIVWKMLPGNSTASYLGLLLSLLSMVWTIWYVIIPAVREARRIFHKR